MYAGKIRVLSCLLLKEMLPLLLSPSPAVTHHVMHALSTIISSDADASALAQLRALTYAVLWEASADFLANPLEGDRWLVWAASSVRDIRCQQLLSILIHEHLRRKSRLPLFCLHMLLILVREGLPTDELRSGTSSPQID
jgi:hypothetical protein